MSGIWAYSRKGRQCDSCQLIIRRGEVHYHFKGRWKNGFQDCRLHNTCYKKWQEAGYAGIIGEISSIANYSKGLSDGLTKANSNN